MTRLGEYLRAFGDLLGEETYVHFEAVRRGSTVLVATVDHVAVPKVTARVRNIAAGGLSDDERKAYRRVDDMLRDDNAKGQLVARGNVIHVDFQGRDRPEPLTYGPIKQFGSIDGEVTRIEGRDDTVHVGVRDGSRSYSLTAPANRGQELAALFRRGPVRFHGEGTWIRAGDGAWELKRFRIDRFTLLDDAPLSEAVNALRAVGAGGWAKVSDPLAELAAERSDDEVRH